MKELKLKKNTLRQINESSKNHIGTALYHRENVWPSNSVQLFDIDNKAH